MHELSFFNKIFGKTIIFSSTVAVYIFLNRITANTSAFNLKYAKSLQIFMNPLKAKKPQGLNFELDFAYL